MDDLDDEFEAHIISGMSGDDDVALALMSFADDFLFDDHDDSNSMWGGSIPVKAPNKNRNYQHFYDKLVKDYFSGNDSVYDERDFERRFRVPRVIFDNIWQQLCGHGSFIQKYDALGKPGIHPLVKFVACFRKLGYGDACDRDDENLGIAESTLNEILKEFVKLVKREFPQYLHRCPPDLELARAQSIYRGWGFPGCFASWDCKHFVWKNCPMALAGQHRGKEGKSTLVLEAICDGELYIWHSFFGEAGSLNDLDILDKSSIVLSILDGSFNLKSALYEINRTGQDWLYFLVDGIYPSWAIFIDSIHGAIEQKERHFSKAQEAARKDIERCFGVLVQRFQILNRPLHNFY